MNRTEQPTRTITVEVNHTGLDEALEKANRLVELLKEASSLIDSLYRGVSLES